MEYAKVCDVYDALENTTKGLEKVRIIADFLNEIRDKPEVIYLLQGRVFADYDPRDLGMSAQLVIRAISKASGHEDREVVELFRQKGDLGRVALEMLNERRKQTSLFTSRLSVDKVFSSLKKISELEGKGTVNQKIGYVIDLLHSTTKREAKYVVRTVLGDLKVGVGSGIIRDAIVKACFSFSSDEEKKNLTSNVQEAYDRAADFALVFRKACEGKLETVRLSPKKPVKVMLYPKAEDAQEAFSIVGRPAAFEYKYDGFRVIINKDEEGNIRIYTRRLEEVTRQFPDVVKRVKERVRGENYILDAEIVGYSPRTKQYTEFQKISQRIRRKYHIERLVNELPVELRVFDILFFEGKGMIEKKYEERRGLLEKIVDEKKWEIALAKQIITDSEEKAHQFFDDAIREGQEGLMVKGLDKAYKPGARIGYGVKWKPEDKELDLVITGAEWGTGKRTGMLTSFDVSCMDDGELEEVGKVSTGLKEKEGIEPNFSEMTKKLKELITEEEGRKVKVKPEIVVSVQYQNIQKSPTYSSGYALRFPRITRLRPDRSSDDVATIDEIQQEAKKDN